MQHTISLIDVLTPPANLWLKKLSRRKADLPLGVRVIRFNDGDDDDSSSDDGRRVNTVQLRLVETTLGDNPFD